MQEAVPDPLAVPPCPRCSAAHVVRNGPARNGTPTFRCRACGRRFVEVPTKGPVPADRRELVERLLGERMGVRAIARVTGLSRSWVQTFVNALYRDRTPHHPGPLKKSPAGS
jgi:transposase-like protein